MTRAVPTCLRLLLFASAILAAAATGIAFASETGICDGSPTIGCAGLDYGTCSSGTIPGCSWQTDTGSCTLKQGGWDFNANGGIGGPCSNPWLGACHPYEWYCSVPYNCCPELASQSSCEFTALTAQPCTWSSSGHCAGTFSGSCDSYNNRKGTCLGLGCDWTYPTCQGNTCSGNYPLGCCGEFPACILDVAPDVTCATTADCWEEPGYTCNTATGKCEKQYCGSCLAAGTLCHSTSECCSGATCDPSTNRCTVACKTEESHQFCTGWPLQGDCCSGLRCNAVDHVCHANRPPAQPPAPQLSPATITELGTAVCIGNCPGTTLPPDPDGDPVSIVALKWYKSGTPGGWVALDRFDCSAVGCVDGDSIRVTAQACDSHGLCSESGLSNQVNVVSAPPAGASDPSYIVLALLIAFSILVLAYMATHIFDAVVK